MLCPSQAVPERYNRTTSVIITKRTTFFVGKQFRVRL